MFRPALGQNLTQRMRNHPAPLPHEPWKRWQLESLAGFRQLALVVLALTAATGSGCREAPPQFSPNLVRAISLEKSRSVPTQAALSDVSVVIETLFGTPNQPRWPIEILTDDAQRKFVSLENLQKAAGTVTSDEANNHTGLYQEHCVICHGISGSGAGPASRFQVPYPRDFRAGVFKWKSTRRDAKPTRNDLERLLLHGVPGAPMPSFGLLPPADRDVIIDYVIYLSIRGEVERELLSRAIDDLDYDTGPPEDDLRLTWVSTDQRAKSTEGESTIEEVVQEVVRSWVTAKTSEVPTRPEAKDLAESIDRGKEIFHGKIANCVGCHGEGGAGGLPSLDYDDWTKDFTSRIGITPEDKKAVKPFRKAGALPPRKIDPRVLAGGVLRGGSDPETLYRRIHHGIAGTPMPSLEISEEAVAGTGLTPDQAWDLVAYVESLIQQ